MAVPWCGLASLGYALQSTYIQEVRLVHSLELGLGQPFSHTGIAVCPDAERYKPPIGHGINKPASILLSFRPGLDECKLRLALAQQPGVTFQSYDTQTGSVAFRVAHF